MEGIRRDRHSLKQLPIAPFRVIQAAGLMVQLGFAQTCRGCRCASRRLAMQLFVAATLLAIHE